MGPIGCPEMALRNYRSTVRKIAGAQLLSTVWQKPEIMTTLTTHATLLHQCQYRPVAVFYHGMVEKWFTNG